MSFSSFSDFIAMGGHGLFVWSAYSITLIVIVGNFVWPVVLQKRNIKLLQARHVDQNGAQQETE